MAKQTSVGKDLKALSKKPGKKMGGGIKTLFGSPMMTKR